MLKLTRRLLILAAILLGLGLGAAPQAEAGWWHRGYGYGYGYYGYSSYYGCGYTSCYSPCYTSVYRPVCTPVCSVSVCDPCCSGWYVGIRPGPIRRCLFGPYRWYRSYGCCSVCYTDPCCCYDSCCVSSVATVVESSSDVQATQKPTLAPPKTPDPAPAPAAGTPNDPTRAATPAPSPTFTPAEPAPAPSPAFSLDADPAPTDTPAAPTPASEPAPTPAAPGLDPLLPNPDMSPGALDPLQSPGASLPASEGTISILVPENAQVSINGYVTKSTGRVRRYVAQNLKPGLVYPFNIQVKVVRDGRTLTDARQVKLSGGVLEAVVFKFDKTSVDRIAQAW